MEYPARAPVSLEDLKDALRVVSPATEGSLAFIASRVVGIMDELTECDVITRLGASEYYGEWHDLAVPQGYVYLRHKPIRAVRLLQSGLPGSMFTFEATDYVFDAEQGMVMLKRGAVNPGAWRPPGFIDFPEDYYTRGLGVRSGAGFNPGVGSVYVEYKGGYLDSDSVQPSLQGAFVDIASRIYRTEENKSQGLVQVVAQGVAVSTRFDPNYVSAEAAKILDRFRYNGKTARRTVAVVT